MICLCPEDMTDVEPFLLCKMTASQWANDVVLGWREMGSWLDVILSYGKWAAFCVLLSVLASPAARGGIHSLSHRTSQVEGKMHAEATTRKVIRS